MIDTSRSMLFHIGNLNTESQRISYQMGSGKNQELGSEDAMLHARLINIEDKLRVTESLKLQITKSNVMNEVADSSMEEMKLSLDSIKVDLLKGLNSGMQRSDKLSLATNLRGIRDNMYDMVNVRVDNEYVFAGSNTTEQTMTKDVDFDLNGQIDFDGDGFLRKVAVQPGSYRDRGVTAYDVAFYTASSANAGEVFTFSEGERIIDENGNEWKLNTAGTQLQQYDHNGVIFHPPVELPITATTPADETAAIAGTGQSIRATYSINVPAASPGRVFEAKHNYFDDLNVIINALEGYSTLLDGQKGAVISDEDVRLTLSNGLELTSKQFDATNIGHGELGGRNKVFEVAFEKLSSQETHYNILLQETGGADMAKLAMESKALEMTYSALYSTISKMNSLSLVNFLK
jgi:flagellar hook-associated protein 3 FlgL